MSRKINAKGLSVAVVIKHFTTTGGAEKYAVEIARRILARGHSVHVFSREIDANAAGGMHTHLIPRQAAFSSAFNLYRFAQASDGRIDRNQFDVVHTHEKGATGDVATVHTFSYLHGLERLSWLKKLNTFYLSPRGLLYYWLEKKQLLSSAVVTVSEMIRSDIQRYFPQTNPIHTITPGVDVAAFNPGRPPDRSNADSTDRPTGNRGELKVLFVGSEFRRKGLDQLILALPEKARLTVVGRGERFSHYHQLVKTAGREKQVVFEGLVDNVHDYYASADVFVLPSLREAFGMAALEAMAVGLPVVVRSTTGVADLIDDGQNGFVFTRSQDLSSILRQLVDPVLRRRIGANARQTAMGHTWDQAADQYEAIYWAIVEEKRRRGKSGRRTQ